MNTELKKALKEKHRGKDSTDQGIMVGEMDLGTVPTRALPNPQDLKIEVEKEQALHSVICRAGYQRNIHRTEGVNYKGLYEDLLAFFLEELHEAGKVVVDAPEVDPDEDEDQGVQEGENDEGAQAPEPEDDGSVRGPPEQAAEAGGDVRDEERGGTGPQLGIPEEQRKRRQKPS